MPKNGLNVALKGLEVLHKPLLPVLVILGRLEYNEHNNTRTMGGF